MGTYYKPSGRISFSSIIYLLVFSITIVPLLSYLYSYSIWEIPFFYVRFFITIIFGGLIGLTTLGVISLGKIRNKSIAIIFALLIASIAIYLHWSSWVHLVANSLNIELPMIVENKGTLNKFINKFSPSLFPSELFKSIKIIINNGVWTVFGEKISGLFYWIIALLEAGIIYFMTFNISYSKSKDPFCEISNSWMLENKLPNFKLINKHGKVIDSVENGNLDFINDLEYSNDKKQSYSTFTFYSSDYNCYLKLENKIAYKDFSDSTEHKNNIVIDNIKVEEDYMEEFLKLLSLKGKEGKNNILKTEENIVEKAFDKQITTNEIINDKKKEEYKTSKIKKKKKHTDLYIFIGILVLVIIGLYFSYTNTMAKMPSAKSTEIVKINHSNIIRKLLLAEENRDFDLIYSFYSPNLRNYWTVKHPSYELLKEKYKRSWKLTSNTKNYIKNIEKINDSIYDLNTEFEYYHNKKKKTISKNSKVRFIFDKKGKIVEVYGIDNK